MNPYRLKNVFEYLTSNNQLLKRKLKLGTSEIPIPPKRQDVIDIEAINRFNKNNPRVDTTNVQPVVKQSTIKQSNVGEIDEGVIQGAFDTATMEARDGGYPAPVYEAFKKRYLKRNMKADGGRIGYKDGEGVITVDDKIDEMISFYKDYLNQGGKMDFKTFSKKYIPENFAEGGRAGYKDGPKLTDFLDVQASGSKSGKQQIEGAPKGITADSETINAIIKADIPVSEKINLLATYGYGKSRNRIENKDQEIFLDEGGYRDRNVGIDFNRDGEGLSGSATYGIDTGEPQLNIKYKKSFADGGMLVQPSDDGSRPGYAKMKLDDDTIQKIKNKVALKKGQKWNFYDPETNPKGHTYGVPKGDTNYDIARNLKPGRLEAKLEKATEKYKEIKADPKLLAEKKLTDKERYQTNRTQILEDKNFQYETDKDYREKKLEWAKQDRIKNPEKYKQKLNDYFAKKGRFPPGNNYKENVWRDMFRSSQKAGQERFLLVGEDGKLLTQDKFPIKEGKVRWDIGGAYKKVKFYDTKTKQFVKFDNTTKGKGISFEKYLDQKSVGGKGAYEDAINGYKNKDNIKDLTFKNSKGKDIRLGTIVQSKLNDGVNFINSGVNVQHPDINNAFWKNEVSLASSNNELNYLEQTLDRKLKNAGNDVTLRNKALSEFKTKINKLEGGITKIIDGETFGVAPNEKSVVKAVGKESRLNNFKEFKTLVAALGPGTCSVFSGKKADGGRIGLATGTPNIDKCYDAATAAINSGKVPVDKADDFTKLLKRMGTIGRGIRKFGIIPEAMYVAADSLVRLGMGSTFKEAGLLASDYLLPGDQTKAAEMSKVSRIFGDTTGELVGRVIDYKNQLAKIQSLEDQISNLDNLSDVGEFDYMGDLSGESNTKKNLLSQAKNDLDNKFKISEAEQLYAERKQEEAYDASSANSSFSNLKRKYGDSSNNIDDIEQLASPEKTQLQLNLDMLPAVPKDFMMTTDDELTNYVNAESVRSGEKLDPQVYIDEKEKLKKDFMTKGPGVYGAEQVYGTQGIFAEPLLKSIARKENSINDLEREVVGQRNKFNIFDRDHSVLGTGLRGFSAASGGIASLTKTIPPESGPTPQGLPYVYNNVKKI